MKIYNSTEYLDLLHFIQTNSNISQRELAQKCGLSLGKVNYCLKDLIEIGYVKIKNFQDSPRKFNYLYLLTPSGIINKTLIAKKFLIQKRQEYDKLKSYLNI